MLPTIPTQAGVDGATANGAGTPAGIALRGSVVESSVASPTATYTVTKPTGVVAGDVMVCALFDRTDTVLLTTPPSGWTQLEVAEAGNILGYLYRKVAGGSEPASYDFGWAGATTGSWAIAAYSGVDNGAPIDDTSQALTTSGTSHTHGSIVTTVAAGQIILFAVEKNVNTTFSQATLTERADAFDVPILFGRCVYDGPLGVASTPSAITGLPIVSGATAVMMIFAVALKPA